MDKETGDKKKKLQFVHDILLKMIYFHIAVIMKKRYIILVYAILKLIKNYH